MDNQDERINQTNIDPLLQVGFHGQDMADRIDQEMDDVAIQLDDRYPNQYEFLGPMDQHGQPDQNLHDPAEINNEITGHKRQPGVELSSYMPQQIRKLAANTQMNITQPILWGSNQATQSRGMSASRGVRSVPGNTGSNLNGDLQFHHKARVTTGKKSTDQRLQANRMSHESLASTSKNPSLHARASFKNSRGQPRNQFDHPIFNQNVNPRNGRQRVLSGNQPQHMMRQRGPSSTNSRGFLAQRKMSQERLYTKVPQGDQPQCSNGQAYIYIQEHPNDQFNLNYNDGQAPQLKFQDQGQSYITQGMIPVDMQMQQYMEKEGEAEAPPYGEMPILALSPSEVSGDLGFLNCNKNYDQMRLQNQQLNQLIDRPIQNFQRPARGLPRPFSSQNAHGRVRQRGNNLGSSTSSTRILNQIGRYSQYQNMEQAFSNGGDIEPATDDQCVRQIIAENGQLIDAFSDSTQHVRQKGISHVLLNNLQNQKQREYKLKLQEQLYAQKLAKIRRILKKQNLSKQNMERTFQSSEGYNIPQVAQAQISRFDRLKKLQQLDMVRVDDSFHQKEQLNQQLLLQTQQFQSQFVDQITPSKGFLQDCQRMEHNATTKVYNPNTSQPNPEGQVERR